MIAIIALIAIIAIITIIAIWQARVRARLRHDLRGEHPPYLHPRGEVRGEDV